MNDTTQTPLKLNYADTGSNVDMEAHEIPTVKKTVIVDVNFKPKQTTGFIRMHEKQFPLFVTDIPRATNPKVMDRYVLQLSKEDMDKFARKHKIKKAHFSPLITASGAFGFWPRLVAYGNGEPSNAVKTSHVIWQAAQKHWIKVDWNARDWAYEYDEPLDPTIFPTDEELLNMWPTEDFGLMLERGLDQSDIVITDLEDIRIQRIMGAAL